jgi:hypothetical protein
MSGLLPQWVTCDGGPLLVLAKENLPAWEGSATPSQGRKIEAQFRWNSGGPATDYDRACDVEDYIALIDVGAGKGMVLGGEESDATWLPLVDGGLLVRWVYGENDEGSLAAVDRIPKDAFEDSGLSFSVGESPLVLFAACESSGDQIYPRIEFQIAPGCYQILTSHYEEIGRISLICHRLKLKSVDHGRS